MLDARKSLDGMSKYDLVRTLDAAVRDWPGMDALGRERESRINGIVDLLERCPLSPAEEHWLALCQAWAVRASRKPDDWLRYQWMLTLQAWVMFLAMDGYERDAQPGQGHIFNMRTVRSPGNRSGHDH